MDTYPNGPEPAAGSLLRQIPAVDELLNRPSLRELEGRVGHRLVVEATRKVLQGLRERISRGSLANISAEWLEERNPRGSRGGDGVFAPARHQRHGSHPAHQPGPRAAGTGSAGSPGPGRRRAIPTWSMIWSAASAANAMSTRTGSSADCWARSGRWWSITTPPPSFWP